MAEDNKEEETLDLPLNKEEAEALVLILKTFGEGMEQAIEKSESSDDPEAMNTILYMQRMAEEIGSEVLEICKEFSESETKPSIILKPKWD